MKEIQAFEVAVSCLGDQKFNFNNSAEIFYLTFSVAENEMQRELQTMIQCIFSQFWSMTRYESKTWNVLNHHPQLQLKMFSRTWDFPKFPTQGWVDTTFCTIKWNRTYEFQKKMLAKDIEVDLQDKY